MADDVTFVENLKEMRIFYVFHIYMKIHKIVSLALFSIFLYENLQIHGKNTEELENWVRNLKEGAQVPVFDPQHMMSSRQTKYGGKGANSLSPEIKMI